MQGLVLKARGLPVGEALVLILNHPKGQERGFYVWLYGRMRSHLRNLLADDRDKSFPPPLSLGSHENIDPPAPEASESLSIPEDEIEELLKDAAPLTSSIIRRLASGDSFQKVAEDLGLSERAVERMASKCLNQTSG